MTVDTSSYSDGLIRADYGCYDYFAYAFQSGFGGCCGRRRTVRQGLLKLVALLIQVSGVVALLQ
jgi:hypothetical protein